MSESGGAHLRPQQHVGYDPITRPEVLRHVPIDSRAFLDVGCAAGGFGRQLRERFGPDARIVGVEPVAAQANRARANGFDVVHDGYFPDDMGGESEKFDVICFNDVLEHCYDPWEVLESAKRYLNPDGVVIAAIPNIQFAPVLKDLILGRWEYKEWGTLDWTHIRFFTRTSMLDLFAKSGFVVTEHEGANSLFDSPPKSRFKFLRFVLRDAQYLHFVLVGKVRF